LNVLTLDSPAKINLFLAVTGRRTDGFHNLLSVVAPLAWGDTLTVEPADEFSVVCDDPAVPLDDTNLVLKAARAFQRIAGQAGGAKFSLVKRIPVGAGLGGGSSNAVTTLRALNQLAGEVLGEAQLRAVAAEIGSDCPLFLEGGPVVMRGRGEMIEPVAERGSARISGRRVLVFKPAFEISTPWAYSRMVAGAPASYLPTAEAERRLAAWLEGRGPAEELLFNNMEAPAFAKFPALPALLDRLSKAFGLVGRMSGSGSGCFAFLPDASPVDAITRTIRDAWGESAFVLQTRLG
jgi:4-diphosphocytidyl-2-C-methyl-D-erythritol kinase